MDLWFRCRYRNDKQVLSLRSTFITVIHHLFHRLRERPNKAHVADGLTALNLFAKTQRKKLSQARSEQAKKKTGANKPPSTSSPASTANPNASSSSSSPAPATAFSFSFGQPPVNIHGPPPPLPFPFSFLPGGMEDVD